MTDHTMLTQSAAKTHIVVFQQNGSGAEKIAGILEFGHDIEIARVISIDAALAEIIDEPQQYVPDDFSGDLVLCFLKHPDLADYLAEICQRKAIPMIAAGKSIRGALTPFTCCGLGRHKHLGAYGEQFGFPEFEAEVENGRITEITVKRGASCGATWEAVQQIIGLTPDEALKAFAREVQYLCTADPSAFDPLSGESALHYAGDVHTAALKKALHDALKPAP